VYFDRKSIILIPINDEIKEIKNAIIKYEISTFEKPLNTPKIISYALESNIKGILIKKDNMTDFLIPDPSNKDIPIIIPDLDIPGNIANDWNKEQKKLSNSANKFIKTLSKKESLRKLREQYYQKD